MVVLYEHETKLTERASIALNVGATKQITQQAKRTDQFFYFLLPICVTCFWRVKVSYSELSWWCQTWALPTIWWYQLYTCATVPKVRVRRYWFPILSPFITMAITWLGLFKCYLFNRFRGKYKHFHHSAYAKYCLIKVHTDYKYILKYLHCKTKQIKTHENNLIKPCYYLSHWNQPLEASADRETGLMQRFATAQLKWNMTHVNFEQPVTSLWSHPQFGHFPPTHRRYLTAQPIRSTRHRVEGVSVSKDTGRD